MRTIFVILILVVVGLIAAVLLGLVDIRQTRPGKTPSVTADDGVIRAEAGQAPAFDVETGSIGVGTHTANVTVPQVEVGKTRKTVNVPKVEVNKPAEPAPQP